LVSFPFYLKRSAPQTERRNCAECSFSYANAKRSKEMAGGSNFEAILEPGNSIRMVINVDLLAGIKIFLLDLLPGQF
jgi:hypothetical protein